MKKMKRWFSAFLVLCLIVAMIPVTASAATSGKCGKNLRCSLSNDGVLTISGTGPMYEYSFGDTKPWDSSCSLIKSVVVEDGVTSICEYAFWSCENLTNVTLSNSVTSIGKSAFEARTNLTEVTLSNNITTISADLFFNCQSLKRITIPNGVTTIGEAAFAHTGLQSVTIPDSVTTIDEYAFFDCTNLKRVTIPDSVTYIGLYAFYGDTSLEEVSIGKNVRAIEPWAFNGCTSLKTIKFFGNAPWFAEELFKDVTATAYYPAGDSTWTAKVRKNYGGDITWVAYMTAPNVSASNDTSSGKIKLTWNQIDGAKEYKVYRATSKGGEYKLMKTTTGTSYTNTSAEAGKAYYYYVVAVGKDGMKSDKSNIVSRTCDLARPEVTVSNVTSTGKVKLNWDTVDGAVKYQVYRAESKNGEYKLIKTTTSTSLTNTSTTAGKIYYYKVKAIAENPTADSAYSVVESRTCDLARPEVEITRSSGKPKVSWDKVTGAASYKVYRATSKSGEYKLVKTTTSLSYKDTKATAGKTYYYKVVAVHSNSKANSAKSSVVSIKSK